MVKINCDNGIVQFLLL